MPRSLLRWTRALGAGLPWVLTAGGLGAQPARITAVVNGRWYDGARGFVRATRYLVNGRIVTTAPARVDTVLDAGGGYVVPPFGEAHNHNLEASTRIAETIARYRRDGVFYVQNPNVLPRLRAPLAGLVNVPHGVDATFGNGGLTGSGGHPIGVVQRNLARGTWTGADGEGAFYWTIDSPDDLTRHWPAIRAQRPDFLKVFLLYSEAYASRRADSATVGWRGLDPALLPSIVRRAHREALRVVAHVETAADFRTAVRAGVDQIAHLPGFRGDERTQWTNVAPYMLTVADAREAARRGVTVVTSVGGVAELSRTGADSASRRAADALHRHNLRRLRAAGVHLAVGSDSYGDNSTGEVRYLERLGVFSNADLLRLWAVATPRAIFPTRAVGSVRPGSEASFLVLRCNPLTRFACTGDIAVRVKDGLVISP